MNNSPAIAVTCGDPTGVGLDIILRIWHRRQHYNVKPFYVIAHPPHILTMCQQLGLDIPLQYISTPDIDGCFDSKLPIYPINGNDNLIIGTPSPIHAHTTLSAIDTAVMHIKNGFAATIMTLPLHKGSLNQAGYKISGHTEYLAQLCDFTSDDVVMMLDSPKLRVVPMTIHIPLQDVVNNISIEKIQKTIKIVDSTLKKRFSPLRIAICGVNPHAGEGGLLGHEEQTIIIPAINGIRGNTTAIISDPLPADTAFMDLNAFDVIIGMYHDQVLAPIKALDFWNTVNVTLGLPFIRTSPDHGTAHTISGLGTARVDSVLAALRWNNQGAIIQ